MIDDYVKIQEDVFLEYAVHGLSSTLDAKAALNLLADAMEKLEKKFREEDSELRYNDAFNIAKVYLEEFSDRVYSLLGAIARYGSNFKEFKPDLKHLCTLFRASTDVYWFLSRVVLWLSTHKDKLSVPTGWEVIPAIEHWMKCLDHYALCETIKYYQSHKELSGQTAEDDATPMA